MKTINFKTSIIILSILLTLFVNCVNEKSAEENSSENIPTVGSVEVSNIVVKDNNDQTIGTMLGGEDIFREFWVLSSTGYLFQMNWKGVVTGNINFTNTTCDSTPYYSADNGSTYGKTVFYNALTSKYYRFKNLNADGTVIASTQSLQSRLEKGVCSISASSDTVGELEETSVSGVGIPSSINLPIEFVTSNN